MVREDQLRKYGFSEGVIADWEGFATEHNPHTVAISI